MMMREAEKKEVVEEEDVNLGATPDDGVFTDLDIGPPASSSMPKPAAEPFTSPVLMPPTPPPATAPVQAMLADDDDEIVD